MCTSKHVTAKGLERLTEAHGKLQCQGRTGIECNGGRLVL